MFHALLFLLYCFLLYCFPFYCFLFYSFLCYSFYFICSHVPFSVLSQTQNFLTSPIKHINCLVCLPHSPCFSLFDCSSLPCLSVGSLSVCLSVCLSACLSVGLSRRRSFWSSVHSFLYQFISFWRVSHLHSSYFNSTNATGDKLQSTRKQRNQFRYQQEPRQGLTPSQRPRTQRVQTPNARTLGAPIRGLDWSLIWSWQPCRTAWVATRRTATVLATVRIRVPCPTRRRSLPRGRTSRTGSRRPGTRIDAPASLWDREEGRCGRRSPADPLDGSDYLQPKSLVPTSYLELVDYGGGAGESVTWFAEQHVTFRPRDSQTNKWL